ncbi:MAG: hypothetical protein AB1498_05600 [bacterium]
MQKKVVLIAVLILFFISGVHAKEVPFTLEDRDRLIRLEAKVENIDKRFEQVDKRFERLENVMMWGFGLILGGMFSLVGFVLWDRRSALAPAIRKNKELEEREEELERWKKKADMALKELAEKDAKVAEILRHVGLL